MEANELIDQLHHEAGSLLREMVIVNYVTVDEGDAGSIRVRTLHLPECGISMQLEGPDHPLREAICEQVFRVPDGQRALSHIVNALESLPKGNSEWVFRPQQTLRVVR